MPVVLSATKSLSS